MFLEIISKCCATLSAIGGIGDFLSDVNMDVSFVGLFCKRDLQFPYVNMDDLLSGMNMHIDE